jgi:hypothetical protein
MGWRRARHEFLVGGEQLRSQALGQSQIEAILNGMPQFEGQPEPPRQVQFVRRQRDYSINVSRSPTLTATR